MGIFKPGIQGTLTLTDTDTDTDTQIYMQGPAAFLVLHPLHRHCAGELLVQCCDAADGGNIQSTSSNQVQDKVSKLKVYCPVRGKCGHERVGEFRQWRAVLPRRVSRHAADQGRGGRGRGHLPALRPRVVRGYLDIRA